MSSTATPMWSILPNIGGQSMRPLDAKDLGHRRDPDLELLGGRLLGRQVALDLAAGGVEGLGQRRAVVAVAPGEHLDRERGAAEADAGAGERAGGLSTNRSSRIVPPAESSIIGATRLEPQRSCSLGTVAGVLDPLLVGGDRLVLDPVVGGQVAVGEGDQGRHHADRLDDALAQRRAGAMRRRRTVVATRVAPIAPSTRGSSKGRRAAGIRARTSGSTAIASASLIGPRRPGRRPPASGRARACARRRPRSRRPGRAPRPPSGSGRGSGGRCGAPSRRAAASSESIESNIEGRRCAARRPRVRRGRRVPPDSPF